jgi:SAM-dependent methyltransferase
VKEGRIGLSKSEFGRDRLERLHEIEGNHFWFTGRRQLVFGLLRQCPAVFAERILDVGCGTGTNTRALLAQGRRTIALDIRPEGLAQLHRESNVPVMQAEAEYLPLSDASLTGMLMLDVLEHVDDVLLLRDAHRALRPGGWVVATVPAMPWLWSYRDVGAGHKRRYTRATFSAVMLQAGFRVHSLTYYQCLLFPLAAVSRFLGRNSSRMRDREDLPGPLLNRILGWVNRIELRLGRYVRWPFGSSLVALCERVG